jgi:hypothetical protein
MFIKIRRILSLIIVLTSVLLIVWVSLPNPHQALTQSIIPTEMQLPSNGQTPIPMLIKTRQISLIWPNSMRIGEIEEITLVFKPVENVASSTKPQVESSDIYKSYNIMVEARFEVAGISVSPANPTRESMPAGQTVKFKWQISTNQVGSYDGNVWLSLRFLPLNGTQASQVPIFIHEVKIQSSSLFGMNETQAYFVGGSGVALGVVIIFGDMIVLIRRWMKKMTTKASMGTKDL